MKIELEPGNPEIGSVIILQYTKRDTRLILKDCEEVITWRFKDRSPQEIADSIRKAERAIVALENLQNHLKAKL